jgi:hypothetical protein
MAKTPKNTAADTDDAVTLEHVETVDDGTATNPLFTAISALAQADAFLTRVGVTINESAGKRLRLAAELLPLSRTITLAIAECTEAANKA